MAICFTVVKARRYTKWLKPSKPTTKSSPVFTFSLSIPLPRTADFPLLIFISVDSSLGNWQDIGRLETSFQLMFDGVINHVSSQHAWVQRIPEPGNPKFQDYFISFRSPEELTLEDRGKIFRPRTSDILTRFEALDGNRDMCGRRSPTTRST